MSTFRNHNLGYNQSFSNPDRQGKAPALNGV